MLPVQIKFTKKKAIHLYLHTADLYTLKLSAEWHGQMTISLYS